MPLPIRISPCPIIDSVIEIRFETGLPDDAAFGQFFPAIKKEYPSFVKLPVAQLPEFVRIRDQSMLFSPHYQGKSGPFIVRFGPRVFSLSNPGEYVGWPRNFPEFTKLFDKVKSLDFKGFYRVGVRYIDYFSLDIFPEIRLSITENDQPLPDVPKSFSCITKEGQISTNLQVANSVELIIEGKGKKGSVIDIDSFIDSKDPIDPGRIPTLVEDCHKVGKTRFFSLLQEKFLETLNPEFPKDQNS